MPTDHQATPLPAPVAAFVTALNAGDAPAMLGALAEDAMVNDQLREYWGVAALGEWIAREVVGQRLRMHVLRVTSHHAHAVVEASLVGSFDRRGLPDPLVVTFYFSLHDDKVDQLLILRNEGPRLG